MSSPHERLKEWFANHYHKEQFRLSMGEIRIDIAGFNTLIRFLAQGVALAGYGEEKYLEQLVNTHEKLHGMIEDLGKEEAFKDTPGYHYALILGALIEHAFQATMHLREEDDGDQAL